MRLQSPLIKVNADSEKASKLAMDFITIETEFTSVSDRLPITLA